MTNVNFKIEDKFNVQQSKTKVIRAAKQALFEIMLKLTERASKEAPWLTGRLSGSIHMQPQRPANKIIVSDGVEYGAFVEFGTSKQRPNPFMQRAKTQTEQLDVSRILKRNNLK